MFCLYFSSFLFFPEIIGNVALFAILEAFLLLFWLLAMVFGLNLAKNHRKLTPSATFYYRQFTFPLLGKRPFTNELWKGSLPFATMLVSKGANILKYAVYMLDSCLGIFKGYRLRIYYLDGYFSP